MWTYSSGTTTTYDASNPFYGVLLFEHVIRLLKILSKSLVTKNHKISAFLALVSTDCEINTFRNHMRSCQSESGLCLALVGRLSFHQAFLPVKILIEKTLINMVWKQNKWMWFCSCKHLLNTWCELPLGQDCLPVHLQQGEKVWGLYWGAVAAPSCWVVPT